MQCRMFPGFTPLFHPDCPLFCCFLVRPFSSLCMLGGWAFPDTMYGWLSLREVSKGDMGCERIPVMVMTTQNDPHTHRCYRMCISCRPRARGGGEYAPLPLVEMVFRRTDPRPMAELYLQSFQQVYAEGLICREMTMRML